MSELSSELMAACQQVKVSDAFVDWLQGESLLLMTDVALLAMTEAEVEQNIIIASGVHFPRIADKIAVRKLWILARACMKDGEAPSTERSHETVPCGEGVLVTIVPSAGSGFEKRRFELNAGDDKAIRFGRSPKENDYALDLPGVSWRHAVVKLWPEGISPDGCVLGIRDLSTNGCGVKVPNEREVRRLTRNKDESLPHASIIMCPLKVKTVESDLNKVRACFAVYVGDNGGMPMKPPEPSMFSGQKMLPALANEPAIPPIEVLALEGTPSPAFSKAPPETPVQAAPPAAFSKSQPPQHTQRKPPPPPPRERDSSPVSIRDNSWPAVTKTHVAENGASSRAKNEEENRELDALLAHQLQERKEIEEANRMKEQRETEAAAQKKELDERLAQQLLLRNDPEEANRMRSQKAKEHAEEMMSRVFGGQREQERPAIVDEHQGANRSPSVAMSESPTSVDMSVASADAASADAAQKKEEEERRKNEEERQKKEEERRKNEEERQKKEEERRNNEELLARKRQERREKEEADRKNAEEADRNNAEKAKADKAAEMMARCMAFARQQEHERQEKQEVEATSKAKVLSEAEKKEEDMRKREEFLAQRRQQRREKEEANRKADEKRAQAKADAAKEEEARQREAVMARKKQEEREREIEEMRKREESIAGRLKERKAKEEADKEREAKAKAKQHAEEMMKRAKDFARQQEQERPTSIKKERIEKHMPAPAAAAGVWTIPDDEDKHKKHRKDRSDSRSRKRSKCSPSAKDKSAPPAGKSGAPAGVWTIPDDEDKRKRHKKDRSRSRSRSRSRKRKRSCSRRRKRSRTHESPGYMPVGGEEDKRKKHKSDRSRSRSRKRRRSCSYDEVRPSRGDRKRSCSRGKDYGNEYYDEAKPSRGERKRSSSRSKGYGNERQDYDYMSKDYGKERPATKDYDYKSKDYGNERQDYDYRSKDQSSERQDYDYRSKDYGNERPATKDYDYRGKDYGNERPVAKDHDEPKPSSNEKKSSSSGGQDYGKERVIPTDYGDGDKRSKALKAKDYGNTAFQAQRFEESIQHYSAAIKFNPTDAVFFSNRSGAYASLKQYTEALKDAEECVRLRPDWWKAFSRRGTAEFHLDRLADAERTFTRGLGLQPEEQSLKDGLAQVRLAKAIGPKGAK